MRELREKYVFVLLSLSMFLCSCKDTQFADMKLPQFQEEVPGSREADDTIEEDVGKNNPTPSMPEGNDSSMEEDAVKDDPMPSQPKIVCDPFDKEVSKDFSESNGIKGQLFYPKGQSLRTLDSYFKEEYRVNAELFFTSINVPTRAFDTGFIATDDSILQDENGNKLFEWFAIQFNGHIHLSDEEEEGYYQFASLSDDGIQFNIDNKFGNSDDLDLLYKYNDITATRITCAKRLIYFTKEDKRRFELKYFQGPRMHIANVLMWRKIDIVDSSMIENYTRCGKSQSDWKVLRPQNFLISSDSSERNKCYEGPNQVYNY